MKLPSIKIQLIIFLAFFALSLAIDAQNMTFLLALIITVTSALAAEALPVFVRTQKIRLSSSAAITGLIVGFVLASDEPWWKLGLAAVAAIVSKSVFRFEKKHLFNPAAFGILFAVLLMGASTEWKGTYLWQLLVPAGLYFSYKIRKLELLAAYAIASLALFGTETSNQGLPLSGIFGYFSYFYIFIMVIEPKTTPVKVSGKFVFGLAIACVIFVLTKLALPFDAELTALLFLNVFTPFLNRMPAKGPSRKRI